MLLEQLLNVGFSVHGSTSTSKRIPSSSLCSLDSTLTQALPPLLRWILKCLASLRNRRSVDFSSNSKKRSAHVRQHMRQDFPPHIRVTISLLLQSMSPEYFEFSLYSQGEHVFCVSFPLTNNSRCFQSKHPRALRHINRNSNPGLPQTEKPLDTRIFVFLLIWVESTGVAANQRRNTAPFLGYHSFSKIKSPFGFLRCFGPLRLRPGRRVLVNDDEYQILHVGRGAFATISRVLHKQSGDMRVMKRIIIDKGGIAQELAQAEVNGLKAVAGFHWFPTLLNHFMDEEEFIITMPYYRRGDLAGLIEHKGYLGRELAQFYCAELIVAIQSLHSRGIVHRDIKPDNIFLDEDGHIVLADFGLAENIGTFEGETETAKFPVWLEAKARGGENYPLLWVDGINPLGTRGGAGTFWYTAPEVFRHERYSFGVDYWSVGVIYYELVTGRLPFNNFKPYPENKRPSLDFRWKPGQLQGVQCYEKEALKQMLAALPGNRLQTVTEIKNCPLFSGVEWENVARKEILPPLLPQPLLEG